VSDDNIANIQATDPFFRAATGPNFVNQQQLEQISAGENSFLFEALGAVYGGGFTSTPTLVFETTIEYADGSTTTKRQEVGLDLRDIKQFYTRWDINYGVNGGSSGTDLREDLSFQNFATPTTAEHTSQVINESFFSGADTTVFVHGWNNSDDPNNDEKSASAETMFKRLYWQGYRGEFVTFNWPTYTFEFNIFDPTDSTYNPSDFQAYRSAKALKEVLAGYRGTFPNLQPVHLLAHSMGNIVAGEALRQWAFDLPFNDDPLVTTYVAMQAAVSAGAYGSNDTDSLILGRPFPDLYRFWSHGRDGLSDPGLGTQNYFQGAGFSSEEWVNFYNPEDFAVGDPNIVTGLWDLNNIEKDSLDFDLNPHFPSNAWPFGYGYVEGAGGNTNTDDFWRFNADFSFNLDLTLTDAFGRPGPNAYEILAFFAQSASMPVGFKSVNFFDTNTNIQSFGLLGGNNIRANHSYQFNHDAAETWDFYASLKAETGFGATHGVFAAAIDSTVFVDANSATRLADFTPFLPENKNLRPDIEARTALFDQLGHSEQHARLDSLLTENRHGVLKSPMEFSFLRQREEEDQELPQELNELFFDHFESNFAQTQLSSSFEKRRLPS